MTAVNEWLTGGERHVFSTVVPLKRPMSSQYYNVYVAVRGQLEGIVSLLPPYGLGPGVELRSSASEESTLTHWAFI